MVVVIIVDVKGIVMEGTIVWGALIAFGEWDGVQNTAKWDISSNSCVCMWNLHFTIHE